MVAKGVAQLALSDVFACAKLLQLSKKRKVLLFMSNLLEVSNPLWLVVTTFALPFILVIFSLILSNLRNGLRRGMQMLVRATAIASRLAWKSHCHRNGLCGIFARTPSSAHAKHVPEERSIWLMYFSDLEQINLIDQRCRSSAQGDAQERILDALEDHMDCLERTPLYLIPDLPAGEWPNPIDAIPPALPGQPPAPWTNPYDDPPNEGERGFDSPGTGRPSDDDYYYTLGSLIPVKLVVCQLILSIELGAIADALAVDLSICDAHRDRQLEWAEQDRDF